MRYYHYALSLCHRCAVEPRIHWWLRQRAHAQGSNGDFTCSTYSHSYLHKDLGLALNAASNAKAAVPLGSLAGQIYQIMCAQGYAGKDFSSAYDFLNKKNE